MPREGISTVRGARLVDKLNVILFVLYNISSDMWSNFMSVSVELEICMVDDDKDRMCCAFKQIIPVFEPSDNGQEFPIVYRVVLFGC
jgi:hypothetical protein